LLACGTDCKPSSNNLTVDTRVVSKTHHSCVLSLQALLTPPSWRRWTPSASSLWRSRSRVRFTALLATWCCGLHGRRRQGLLCHAVWVCGRRLLIPRWLSSVHINPALPPQLCSSHPPAATVYQKKGPSHFPKKRNQTFSATRAFFGLPLTVFKKEVPLAQAKAINGLRAVFGEVRSHAALTRHPRCAVRCRVLCCKAARWLPPIGCAATRCAAFRTLLWPPNKNAPGLPAGVPDPALLCRLINLSCAALDKLHST